MDLASVDKAQRDLSQFMKAKRVAEGLTQEGLAERAGVSVASLRRFEQKGLIAIESFLKIANVLGIIDQIVKFTREDDPDPSSIKFVQKLSRPKKRKYGWRK